MKTTMENIIAYFKENKDVFESCMESLDSYDGTLDDERYYNMEELEDMYCDTPIMELLYRVFYGHDEDSYTIDSDGNKRYSEFNPNRTYFSYSAYGNLVSSDYKDYSAYLDEYYIEKMAEYRNSIYDIDNDPELAELFDKLENEKEMEQEENNA